MIGMMRRRTRIGALLQASFAIWLAAVAIAPLWHGEHNSRGFADHPPEHAHGLGAYLCGQRPATFEPDFECILCGAKRLLSQCWTRAATIVSVPVGADRAPAVPPVAPIAGLFLPCASRAPPLV
jgi:hypothetical protein